MSLTPSVMYLTFFTTRMTMKRKEEGGSIGTEGGVERGGTEMQKDHMSS